VKGLGYTGAMGIFNWFFRKKVAQLDPDSEPLELWRADKHHPQWRWTEEFTQDFELTTDSSGPELWLSRPRLFAWSMNPFGRYQDFSLKARIQFLTEGYGAAGFVFRHMDDSSFYYFLVSNQGQFRFDVVFNGSPHPVIPWTPAPSKMEKEFDLQIIARGASFVFSINGIWAGEASDEMLEKGHIGLACQNFNADEFSIKLHICEIESREIQVEKEHSHWSVDVSIPSSQRMALAEVLASGGFRREAAYQLSKLRAKGEMTREATLLLSQCWMEEGLYEEALGAVENLLETEPWFLALKQKASILYLQSRFLDLRDYILPLSAGYPQDGLFWMYLGHSEFQLANYEKAAEAYARWFENEPDLPLAPYYTALSWEKAGDPTLAMRFYPRAAELFFRQESWNDLDNVLGRMKILAPENGLSLSLEGKIAYKEGDFDKALELIRKGRKLGDNDAALDYLEAMILRDKGDREAALEFFSRAVEKEPQYGLFRFRYAEMLFGLGKEGAAAEARESCRIDPNSAWAWNLLGLTLETGSDREAAFLKAMGLDPELEEPLLNLAWELNRQGRQDEALSLLSPVNTAASWNMIGNFYTEGADWKTAQTCYEKALELEPDMEDALANIRRPLWESGHLGKLDNILSKLLEFHPQNTEYLLDMAELSWSLGDWPRGELAINLIQGIQPGHEGALRSLVRHYLQRARFDKASQVLEKAKIANTEADWTGLEEQILRATHDRLQCASCSQHWFIPKNFPDPGTLRLVGEPPGKAPAGKSPVTGKVYCVNCAQIHLLEGRFICPESGEPLVLDKTLVYLLKRFLEAGEGASS